MPVPIHASRAEREILTDLPIRNTGIAPDATSWYIVDRDMSSNLAASLTLNTSGTEGD